MSWYIRWYLKFGVMDREPFPVQGVLNLLATKKVPFMGCNLFSLVVQFDMIGISHEFERWPRERD